MHHHGRLRDQRQPLLHAVLERGASRGAQLPQVVADAVTRRECHQRDRLASGLAQPCEDLAPPAAPRRVDGRPGEHHRADALRPSHGELGDDLTAHRVGNERRALEPDLVEPGEQRVGVLADPGRGGRTLAPPVAGEVRDVHRTVDGEGTAQGNEIAPGDAVSVQEYDRRPVAPDARMDADTADPVGTAPEPRQ